jgi:endonuclease-3 related protein
MQIDNSLELYERLLALDLMLDKPPYWWPGYGTFEVVAGSILTQNTKWERVERSLDNLRDNTLLSLEALAEADVDILMMLVRPSGFYKNKARYLKMLCMAIIDKYGDFERFVHEVDRDWLLEQKGIGLETADSILCYGCRRDVMVVDAYTARLLEAFGYKFESYCDLQEWCEVSIRTEYEQKDLSMIFAGFHGMIVEYIKRHKKGKSVNLLPIYL